MSKLLKEQWSRLAFGKRNTSINEVAGAPQPQGEFQELAYQLLQAGSEDAGKIGWLLTIKDFDLRHVIVDMGLGEIAGADPEYPEEGEGITPNVPGRENEGPLNKQTGKPIGVSRGRHFAEFPDVAIEFLQNAQVRNPPAYAALEKQFFKTATKWGLI